MPKPTFYRFDESTLRNALRVALEVYEGHAKEFRDAGAALRANPPPPEEEGDGTSFSIMPRDPVAMDRLAEQFDNQAQDVRVMMDRLEGPEGFDEEEGYAGEVEVRAVYTPDEDDARQGPWARP